MIDVRLSRHLRGVTKNFILFHFPFTSFVWKSSEHHFHFLFLLYSLSLMRTSLLLITICWYDCLLYYSWVFFIWSYSIQKIYHNCSVFAISFSFCFKFFYPTPTSWCFHFHLFSSCCFFPHLWIKIYILLFGFSIHIHHPSNLFLFWTRCVMVNCTFGQTFGLMFSDRNFIKLV